MRTFLIVLLILIIVLSVAIGLIGWKMKNLVSPELVDKVMTIYRENSTVEAQTITSVQQLAMVTSISSTIKGKDPITVTPATLNGENITLITLGGTQNREGQATTMNESKLASQGKSNDYLVAVLKLFENGTVPKDKPILVAGISLGGMIAQQLLGEKIVTDNYEIKAIITFGSPLTMPFERNGVKVVRFVDKHDMVPKLGEMNLKPKATKKELNNKEVILKTSKYKDAVETHALSYIEDDCWNETDFLGDKAKKNVLVTLSELQFYPAPIITK